MTERKFTPPNPDDFPIKKRMADGREVTLLAQDDHPKRPLVGRVEGNTSPDSWTLTGTYFPESPSTLDLHDIPEKHVRYMNVYPNYGATYRTRENAERAAGPNLIARVRIEFEEGQLDD